MGREILDVLRRRPMSSRDLLAITGDIQLVDTMRKLNDKGFGPIVSARGTSENGGMTMIYWIVPNSYTKPWRLRFAKYGVTPEEGEVV